MIFEEWFYSFSRKFLKVCSGSVLEEAKVYSRTVLEQTIRTFLECTGTILKMFYNDSDIYRMLNETFLGVFYNCSRKILKVCSRTNQG